MPDDPPISSWRLYGHWSERVGAWWGVYGNRVAARMHAGRQTVVALDAHEVAVSPDTRPDVYLGWLSDRGATPSLIYPTRRHFEMCFPGGSDAASAQGRGRVLALVLEEAPDPDPETEPQQ